MLASLSWLRELCPCDADANVVASALTGRGLTVDAVNVTGEDVVLDVDVPANRPDCLGHFGLAREIAAAFGIPVSAPPEPPQAEGESVARWVRVVLEDRDLCPRYTARVVRGVSIGPSPPWVVSRLAACGLRSINNVVDTSNLVLLLLGHPVHTFDLSRIHGATIIVRRARMGEVLVTLDGAERRLERDMLLIADPEHPVALAGIMGGVDTEIRADTRDVLIEAAHFLPRSVRATSRILGLRTDASHRFERGVDPEGVLAAQAMAVRLLVELAEGVPVPGLIDIYPVPVDRRTLAVRHERIRTLLGFDPGREATVQALAAVGLEPEDEQHRVMVRVPSWRMDLDREVDLIEEVARHLGYGGVPSHLPPWSELPQRGGELETEERCRDILASLGFHEACVYSLISAGEDDPYVSKDSPEPLRVENPIADWLRQLRRSLLPGLVRAVDLNLRRGSHDVRLFEVGRVFLPWTEGGFPDEPVRVGVVWTGASRPRHWSSPQEEVQLQDIAGILEALILSLRPKAELQRVSSALPCLHPLKSIAWKSRDDREIAWCGELHPSLQERLGLTIPLYLGELDLNRTCKLPLARTQYSPLPRVPMVTRDLSLVLRPHVLFEQLLETLRSVAAPAPVEFELKDRYEGPPLSPGEVSLTVRVILQPLEKTLTDAETEGYRQTILVALRENLGVGLRG